MATGSSLTQNYSRSQSRDLFWVSRGNRGGRRLGEKVFERRCDVSVNRVAEISWSSIFCKVVLESVCDEVCFLFVCNIDARSSAGI
ncbi:hypothetical protein TNCV_749111 [Trichonephila clavipes]|nr:hypothetical protein TNCV_749111 [Trichonephila clavipes]